MNERLVEIRARKAEIREMLNGTEAVDLQGLETELRDLNTEEAGIEKRQQMAQSINDDNPIEPVQKREKPNDKKKDAGYDSDEYRNAFMEYVCRGKKLPQEFRGNDNTLTTDIGAVIPPVTLNKIIEKIEAYGMILPLVTRTSYRTGMVIPNSDVKPVATWVAEGAGSDKQKKTTGSITFSHYKLRCAVSVSLETEYMALSSFEAALINNISEALAKALEQAILMGTGEGQPTGILKDISKASGTVTTNKLTYENLVDAEGQLPMEYENGAVWVMSKKTFMGFVGMVDTTGQPIARVTYGIGGVPERSLLGRRVVLTKYLPSFTTTLKKTDVFAMLYNFADYTLNTNLQVGISTYEDHETDDIVRKSIIICDGKPILLESLIVMAGTAEA